MTEAFAANANKLTVVLAFAIDQRVRIKDIDLTGIVYGVNISRDGLEYDVRWFSNSNRCSSWFRAAELEAA